MSATINELTQADISASDQIPYFSTTNGGSRRTSLAQLQAVVLDGLEDGTFATQYAAPSATGFNVAIAPPTDGQSVWMVLTPAAGYAAGTITLPAVATCAHGQELLVNTTQAVTALTMAGNGATVTGAPATLAANAFFRLKFESVLKIWYRVG